MFLSMFQKKPFLLLRRRQGLFQFLLVWLCLLLSLLFNSSHGLSQNQFTIGEYDIQIQNNNNEIVIINKTNTKTILHIVNIQTAIGRETIEEFRGLFQVKDQVESKTDEFTVTEAQQQQQTGGGSIVILEGELVNVPPRIFFWRKRSIVANYKITFSVTNDALPQLRYQLDLVNPISSLYNRLYIIAKSFATERFYGLGEQFAQVEHKGNSFTIVTSEQGVGRGADYGFLFNFVIDQLLQVEGNPDSTYAPMPYFFTNTGRAMLLENYDISVFDLTSSDTFTVKILSTEMIGRLWHGSTALDVIESLTQYTGRMKPLPEWFHSGACVGIQGGTEFVKQVIAKLQALDTPIASVWLQDWVGTRETLLGKQLYWNWILDESTYPNWDGLVQDLSNSNIRVMTYVSPFISNVFDIPEYNVPNATDLYDEALRLGYLILNNDGDPYSVQTDFDAALVDFTNPNARIWMKNIIKNNVIGVGASGYMLDFGEAVPFDSILFSKQEDPKTYHNQVKNKKTKNIVDLFFWRAVSFLLGCVCRLILLLFGPTLTPHQNQSFLFCFVFGKKTIVYIYSIQRNGKK